MISVRTPHAARAAVALRRLGLVLALAFSMFASPSGLRAAGGQDQQLQDASVPDISPSALAQIDAVLREKASRSPLERKIDSRILHELTIASGKAATQGLQQIRSAINYQPDSRIALDVQATITSSFLIALRDLGAEVVNADVAHRNVTILVTLDQIELLAALPQVTFIQPKQEGVTGAALDTAALFSGTGQGSQTSEGDATHRAAAARSLYGVNGTGVKIGVLSDGVAGLSASQSLGDLGAVTVLSGQAGPSDGAEGTAMLEIIHDLAPGAQLYFATAFTSITSFAQNIRDLRAAGCDIIVDDVYYYGESPFQDGQATSVHSTTNGGVVAQAVKDVTASGALYFSSAGNSGNKDAGWSGTWEGDFVDGGAVALPNPYSFVTGRIHSFGAQTYDVITSNTGNPIELYWADPLGAATDDYDLFVLNSSGTSVLTYSANDQNGTQDPREAVNGQVTGSRIVIVKYAGNTRFLHLGTNRSKLSISTTGETHGHNSTTATGSFGVAATPAAAAWTGPAAGPYPNAFSASNVVEVFSSDGPRRIFFAGDGSALTPGNFTSSGGQVLNKPDITAADGVSVTGVGGFGSPFYGTSAAAPHAAAIAALIKSKSPWLNAAQVRAVLTGTAIDIQASGVDRDSGAGIVMAEAALATLPVPTVTITTATTVAQGGTIGFSVANGPANSGDWVGLFPIGAANSGYVDWWYLNGTRTPPGPGLTSATLQFAAPTTAGTYEVRLFSNGVKAATSGTVTVLAQPTLSINDVSVTEGNSGTVNATFTVTLNQVSTTQTVTVNYATANGTATAGSDYTAASGTLTFNPSVATQTFTVAVSGDLNVELNETFVVNLTSPTNAVIGDSQGVGTITNDDFPVLTINDVSVSEGDSGTTAASFTVTLTPMSPQTVTVNYTTADGTATAGSDYVAKSGTVTFAPGTTTQTFTVAVNGDLAVENNETFFVNLNAQTNALMGDTQGQGTIANDDPPAPTMTVNTPTVNPGNTISVSFLGPSDATDWVGLFASAAPDSTYVDWEYLNGTRTAPSSPLSSGTLQFTAPSTPGTYEVRYFRRNTFTKTGTSSAITVALLPTLTINDVSVAEGSSGSSTARFTVTLSPVNTTQAVTVNYATANGTATTADSDYASTSGTLTFNPFVATQTIAVTINGDTAFEPNETFVVNLSNPANAIIGDPQGQGTITNDDAAPPPSVTINTGAVNPGGTIGFTVANGPAVANDWVGLYPAGVGGPVGWTDWLYLNGQKSLPGSGLTGATLQFAAPATPGNYVVRLVSNGAVIATSGPTTVQAPPTLSIDDVSLTEGNSGTTTATFTVTLNPLNTTQTVTVAYATANGTATTAGSDYVAASGTLTFTPSTATQTINVTVNGDVTNESNETFFVNLSNPVNALVGDNQGIGTITNDDTPPAPSVTINTPSVGPGGAIGFTVANGPANATDWVALFSSTAADTTYVDWMYLNGTKTAPGAGLSGATLQFTAPTPLGTYNIRLFSNNSFTKLATSGLATVAPTPTLTINDVTVTEGNTGTATATFTVTLNPVNTTQTVTVAYATANSTATAGSDYTLATGTLTFNPSVATQTISVSVTGDTTVESAETFFVNLSSPANAIIGDSQGVGTISNDDALPGPSVTMNTSLVHWEHPYSFTVANGPGNATDWFGFYSPAAPDETYIYKLYLNGSTTPPATGLTDVTIQLQASSTMDGVYNVRLFNGVTGAKLATSGNLTVSGVPTLTINDVSVTEGDAGTRMATFTVVVGSMYTDGTVTVDYATADGTATAGIDYVATSGTLVLTPSSTTQTISVPVNGDIATESAETFFVNLSLNPSTDFLVRVFDSQGQATIVNDDVPPGPAVTLTTPNVSAGGTIGFTVTNGPANVTDRVALVPSAGADDAAIAWKYLNGTQTPPATGIANATLSFVAPSMPGSYNVRLFAGTSTLTTSSDVTVAAMRTLTIYDISAAEGTGGVTNVAFTVTLSSPNPTQSVSVDYATANGTATAGSDYYQTSGTAIFNPSETTQIIYTTVLTNALLEPDETFFMNLSGPVNAVIGDGQGQATILNDDGPSVTLDTTDVNAGGTIGFTVVGGPAHATDWVGLFAVGAMGGNTSYQDWLYLDGTKLLPASGLADATLQFTAPVPASGNYEVRLISDGVTVATSGAVVIHLMPAIIILGAAMFEGDAGTATATFNVLLTPVNTTQTVTVDYATADGTATAGTDYVSTAGTLTFPPSTDHQTISVTVNGDRTIEPDERFIVNLSNVTNARLGQTMTEGSIYDDDAAVVRITTTNVSPGGTIGFNVTRGPGNASDWVGLFSSAAADANYVDWMYLNGTKTLPGTGVSSAALHFTAPNPLGTYNVRLFANGGFTKLATSNPATVAPTPTLTINDISGYEHSSGPATATFRFTVTLNPVNTTQTVTVNYATANGTATAGSDYVGATGTLTFTPSTATQTISVSVNGDTTFEPDETFVVNLSSAANAIIGDSQGVATIYNDDGP